MQVPLVKYLLTNKMMNALFLTLLHSLWQGVLLAIAAGFILMLTKRSAAALRHNLLCVALLLFFTGSILTFYYELNMAAASHETISNKAFMSIAGNAGHTSTTIGTRQNEMFHRLILFLESNQDIFIFTWLLVIAFKCLRLLTGLKTVYILKRRQVFDAGAYWNHRLASLAEKIGLRTPVVLLKSTIAKIPMVAGHFKPIILFPAVILSTLPEKEIEAILLHELAHIRRKDYLVNLLQSFTEILFFFNPAVLWISGLIKDERENCCDDIALGEMKNKKQFIHALLSFQEAGNGPMHAASFPGRKNHLVNRVKRIITNHNKTLSNMEKLSLATAILVTGFVLTSFSERNQAPVARKENITQPAKTRTPVFNLADTVPGPEKNKATESKSSINTSLDGKHYKIVEIKGKVTELYVDNVRVPDEKISLYQTTIDKIHQQVKADMAKQAELMKTQEKQMNQKKVLMEQELAKNSEQRKMQQKALMAQSELMKQKEQLMKEELTKNSGEMKEEFEKQVEQMKLQQKAFMEQSELMRQNEQLMKEKFEKQADQMKLQKKLMTEQSEVMKQKQQLMQQEIQKQSDEMKTKKEELMKQMEQLKQQQKLMEKKMLDSMPSSKPIPAKGMIKPAEMNTMIKDIVQEL